MNSKHFLLYYYYGGMIYTALKRYEQALYCLEVVITTPAYAVSHVMLEAYKKYILVSLILYGKVSMTSYYVLVTIIVPRTEYNLNSLLPPLYQGAYSPKGEDKNVQ